MLSVYSRINKKRNCRTFAHLIVAQMWIFCYDSENDDSQLVLQSKTLLYGNSRRKPLQRAVDIEHDLIIFWMCAELFKAWDGVTLLAINTEQERPYSSSQVVWKCSHEAI
jgi:hypothetical protein